MTGPATVDRPRQHRRRHRPARPRHLARPRHDHLHPRRGDRPRAGLGPARRDVAGDGGARAATRACGPTARAPPPTWFNLGDHDLATHLYRTARLAEGASLTDRDRRDRRGLGARPAAAADDRRSGAHHASSVAGEGEIGVPGVLRRSPARGAGRRRCASPAPTRPGLRRRRLAAPRAGRASSSSPRRTRSCRSARCWPCRRDRERWSRRAATTWSPSRRSSAARR